MTPWHHKRALTAIVAAPLLALLLVTSAALPSCTAPAYDCGCTSRSLDSSDVPIISGAMDAHRRADLALESDDPEGAVAALQQFLAQSQVSETSPEVAVVLADTYARLAELLRSQGASEEAWDLTVKGLELAVEGTYLQGRLIAEQATIEELRGDDLSKRDQDAEAAAAFDRASRSFERSIEIQDRAMASGSGCGCGDAVDNLLLAFLSKASASHHLADMAMAEDRAERAMEILERLVEQVPWNRGDTPPEVREVLADTYARLADLHSGAGDFPRAEEDLSRGLELAVETTHFRGRLFQVRGEVEERRARDLEQRGDTTAAKEATERAIRAYSDAVHIQGKVIENVLGDGGTAP